VDSSRTVTDEIVSTASALKLATDSLVASYRRDEAAGGSAGGVPLNEQGDVRNASLSVAMSVELLGNTVRTGSVTAGSSVTKELFDGLSDAVSAMAKNVVKMLHGMEKGIGAMVCHTVGVGSRLLLHRFLKAAR